MLTPIPAHAQVIAIGADGAVVRSDGPALYLTPDLRPQPIRTVQPAAIPAQPGPVVRPADGVASAIAAAAARHGVSPQLVEAVAWQESRFRAGALSPKGARGVMQLMPGTAQALGVDAAAADANIEGGVRYLAGLMQRYDGDVAKSLAAYNAGPGAVARYRGVPPWRETQGYVTAIMERLSRIAIDGGAAEATLP